MPFPAPDALVHLGPAGADEATEMAVAHALLRRAAAGEISEAVHLYSPTGPAVVFGRRDTRLPGFADAAAAARRMGFDVAVRSSGGQAVAYTQNTLVIDHVRRDTDATGQMHARFLTFGEGFTKAFGTLGVDARVGEVPGEYCPGTYSVNARGVVKLVGTAQRIVKNAWLFSSVVIVDDAPLITDVLAMVYAALDLPFEAASVGALRAENPQLTLAGVRHTLAKAWGIDGIDPNPVAAETLAMADTLAADHRDT